MKAIWKLKVPPKINFLLWRIFRNRLPSCYNLLSRNIRVDEGNYNCKFCLYTLETMEYLLVGCPVITEVWNACYGWINLSVMLPRSISDHFCQHNLVGGNWIKQIRWKFMWCAVVWMIWKIRNDIIFQ